MPSRQYERSDLRGTIMTPNVWPKVTKSESNSSSPHTFCTGRGPYTPHSEHTACPRESSPSAVAAPTLPPSDACYIWALQALLSGSYRQRDASDECFHLQALGWRTLAPSLR